jgi:hypothetical protein
VGCSTGTTPAGGDINLTTEQARAQASDNVEGTVGGAVGALSSVAFNADLFAAVGSILGDGTSVPETSDDVDAMVDELNQALQDLFDALLQNPVRNGNTITYTPDAAAVCALVQLGTEQACLDILSHLKLVQTLTSTTTGTLQFQFDGVTAATLGYSPAETWFEIDLAGFKSALILIMGILDPGATLDLPSTFEGAVRITTTTPAQGMGTVTLAITREIRIAGPVDCGDMSVVLGATSKLLQMVVDEQAGTATFELGLAGVDVEIPYEDDAEDCHSAALNLGGLTALLQISANSKSLVLSNVGIGGVPLVLEIDSQEALRVELDTFGMTLDGETGAIALDTDFDLSVTLKNVQAFFESFFDSTDTSLEGSLTVSAPAGTEIQPGENTLGESVGEVTAGGPLSVTGTGELAGDVSVAQGECFLLFPDMSMFPIEKGDCPAD